LFFFEFISSTTDPVAKQSSIASISSNVPLMATIKDNNMNYSTQLSTNTTTTTDVDSFLNSFKTHTSIEMKKKKRFLMKNFFDYRS
jgi:hypothetical protein